MANVFDVAKYILENTGEISTYKLQKLCYYSQAWNLVWHDIPLYDSPIMAFAHGPVIKELYDYHKGQFSIKSSDIKKCKLSNILTDSEKDTINRVLQFYGKIEVLVNVDVFSEGFDCPDVEFVQLARPTLSLAKYLQQVGRGLRRSEGKEACMLIDNVGLYRIFGLQIGRAHV